MEITKDKPAQARKHPNYVLVFIALAILTITELAVTQLPLPQAPILIPLSVLKASLVALFYMHLRTDRKIFGVFFGMGILFGLGLLITVSFLLAAHGGTGH